MNIVQVVMTYLRPLLVFFASTYDFASSGGCCERGKFANNKLKLVIALSELD